MSQANPLWGAPRIHGELLKLGIAVAQSTVARYLPRPRKPPSQTWPTFLRNHLAQTAAIDFFHRADGDLPGPVFVFIVLSHERRRVVRFGVTEHPTQQWTMQQLREAFPWDEAPRYVLRDRDAIYGRDFAAMIRDMEMEEVLTAPRSPWQNPFAERLVGSIRRQCLDHVIVWNEIAASNSSQLFCLLSAVTYAFSLGQRCPGAQGRGTAGTGARGCDSSGRGITPPIPATRRLAGAWSKLFALTVSREISKSHGAVERT
jgi:transposase InsO family protein